MDDRGRSRLRQCLELINSSREKSATEDFGCWWNVLYLSEIAWQLADPTAIRLGTWRAWQLS